MCVWGGHANSNLCVTGRKASTVGNDDQMSLCPEVWHILSALKLMCGCYEGMHGGR